MIGRLAKSFLVLICFWAGLLSHISAGDSATIRVTATVANATGFVTTESNLSESGLEFTSTAILRPRQGTISCRVEADGIILDQFDLNSIEPGEMEPEKMAVELEIPEIDADTLVVTIIYTEN